VPGHKINGKQHYLWRAVGQRERGMRGPAFRKFKSTSQAQRFLGAHAAVSSLFNLGRHLVRAQHYRNLRISAFAKWSRAVA
jgi:putative transposase